MRQVPVLVISGFLGSGKTTLVRHLLACAQAAGRRLAVVSNEFGALGIDEALLGGDGRAYVELAGGCVCCKLSDALGESLQRLYDEVAPDQVVIETSGLAYPYETQLNLWREPVKAWVSDDAAVVVVNAEQLAEGRDLEGTFEEQVGSADLLLLNKCDLVGPEALAQALAWLEEHAPGTPVLPAVAGQVAPELMFPPDPAEARAARRVQAQPAAPHHHEPYATEERVEPGPVDPQELVARLREAGAVRIKGFVQGPAGPLLVQGVGRRVEIGPPPVPVDPALLGRLVLIRRAAGPGHHHG